MLLGAAGASVSGILSHTEGGAGLLFGLALAGGAGWAAGGLLVAVWRRLRRYLLMTGGSPPAEDSRDAAGRS